MVCGALAPQLCEPGRDKSRPTKAVTSYRTTNATGKPEAFRYVTRLCRNYLTIIHCSKMRLQGCLRLSFHIKASAFPR